MVLEISISPLVFNILIILASLVLLVKASDMALLGVTEYARKLGLSDYLIGLIIISLGASMPELVSAIMGVFADDPGVILGTILGSNITGITLVMGASAIFAKKLKLDPHVLEKTEIMTLIMVALPFLLLLNGVLSRIDGGILVAAYLIYIVMIWIKEGQAGTMKKDVKLEKIYIDGIVFVLALAALLLSARWLVFSSIEISTRLGISSYLVALIVIGIGTSLPDAVVAIRSIMKGHKGVGMGNALGSIVVKSTLFLGIISLISPIKASFMTIMLAELFLLSALGYILVLTVGKEMNWKHGIVLVSMYAVFITLSIITGGGS